ncbi:hypothetical protein GCM10023200_51100 [Actinomycetospora chlora]|uniref:Uncharacterized protein n=1 Tax=Actinomycetospora chlora TaxID=663608 RepID=A0ABP9CFK3_9PSEU
MSQPGRPGPPGRGSAPLRVTSERLTEDEARAAAAASPAPPVPAAAVPAAPAATVATATVDATGPLATSTDAWGPWTGSPALPVVAPSALPVVAPRPRRRFGELWRLVFARRRAGRHRPENTPPASWSMFAPQRRRRSRWGRR